jgi:hypothetical protein
MQNVDITLFLSHLPQFWSRIGEQVRDLLATEEIKEITKCI